MIAFSRSSYSAMRVSDCWTSSCDVTRRPWSAARMSEIDASTTVKRREPARRARQAPRGHRDATELTDTRDNDADNVPAACVAYSSSAGAGAPSVPLAFFSR